MDLFILANESFLILEASFDQIISSFDINSLVIWNFMSEFTIEVNWAWSVSWSNKTIS
jgi:hypothetical protein